VVLTIVMYTFVLVELKKSLGRTARDENRKRKIYNRVLYTLVGWTAFTSALGLIGVFQDFSAFPPRIMITLIVPLIAMLVITFSKTMKELLLANTIMAQFQFCVATRTAGAAKELI